MKLDDIDDLNHKLYTAEDIKSRMKFLEEKIAEFSTHTDGPYTVRISINRAEPPFTMQYIYPATDEFLNELVLNMFRYSLRILQRQLEEL